MFSENSENRVNCVGILIYKIVYINLKKDFFFNLKKNSSQICLLPTLKTQIMLLKSVLYIYAPIRWVFIVLKW